MSWLCLAEFLSLNLEINAVTNNYQISMEFREQTDKEEKKYDKSVV